MDAGDCKRPALRYGFIAVFTLCWVSLLTFIGLHVHYLNAGLREPNSTLGQIIPIKEKGATIYVSANELAELTLLQITIGVGAVLLVALCIIDPTVIPRKASKGVNRQGFVTLAMLIFWGAYVYFLGASLAAYYAHSIVAG